MSLEAHSPDMIRRREILRRVAWLLGGTISAPAALAILQGCSARESAGTAPAATLKFLTAAQFATIAEIAEIMLPNTDTAGARDAGVPAFIDAALAALYGSDDQKRFQQGYEEFVQSPGKPFLERDPVERAAMIKHSIESALTAENYNGSHKPFILMTRELALLGYFSSQVGITENMEYVAVPTAFHGCVPLSQMKKHVYWE